MATPETEQALLEVALSGTAAHVEQIVRGWRRVDRTAERTEEKRRRDRRSLRTWVEEDGQCRFPGCGNRRRDAHHIEHWIDGGETTLDNLVLLCRRHHRAVHEEGFRITLEPTGEVKFTKPDCRPFPAAPPSPLCTGEALAPVTERLEREGVEIDSQTATPRWRGERVDIGWAVDSLWRPRSDAPQD